MKYLPEINGEGNDCPTRDILDRFGDKWSMLILLVLSKNEKLRFTELQREIGDISQKMLTVTLRTMEADGLVRRTVFPEVPPPVEYDITTMGKSLVPNVDALSKWTKENVPAIHEPSTFGETVGLIKMKIRTS